MRIIIIGAGIAGFSTYLLLKKHLLSNKDIGDISIQIYEAYDIHKLTADVKSLAESSYDEPAFTPIAIGNALGLSQNGINVLRRLDETGHILEQIKARGNPIHCWRMSNARGWTLADANMVAKGQEEKTDQKDSPINIDDMSIMIARQDLWEILRDEAIKDTDLVIRKKVTSVVIGDGTKKSRVTFEDGTSDEADLVIGADGLRSVLRRDMFQQPNPQPSEEKSSKSKSSWFSFGWGSKPAKEPDYITPTYEGLAGFGGFIPTSSLLAHDPTFNPKVMNIVFGPNGFFGYGCISSSSSSTSHNSISSWWSTFSSPTPYPYHSPSGFDSRRALSDLQTRHKPWKNPCIQHILSTTSQASLSPNQFYPTWTTPELPSWYQGTTVLVGDAAHALQPSSGQGASQAFEDAEALALLLKHFLARDAQEAGVSRALGLYEALRRPRVHRICERARRMGGVKGDMGVVLEMVVYFFIWAMSFFHDKYMDELMGYDLPGEVERIVKAN